jgi:hypothetical protein
LKNSLALLNSKSRFAADPETGLWPAVSTHSRYLNYGPTVSHFLFDNNPTWRSLTGMQDYFNVYHTNPIVYGTIMLKAREWANMNIQVRKRGSEQDTVVPYNTKQPLAKKLYKLWDNPNPLQSRGEFLKQFKIMFEISGNMFIRGNCGSSFNVENLLTIMNIWPQHMQYIRNNSYFDALEMADIIKAWRFKAGEYERQWSPEEILFINNANTEIQDDVIFGRSAMASLYKPISNIDGAYEARNVMQKNRGMRIVFSSAVGDGSGKIPLQAFEVEDLEKRWGNYGMMHGQSQAFFSPYPINVTPIDQNVEKLGLFKEVANDAIVVCHGYGVPDILLKCYIEGITYENQESSLRRLYQGTIIPEAEEFFNSFNKWLGLDQTDYYLWPDYSHIPCLQESEEKKEARKKLRSDRLIAELGARLLTPTEYRLQMEYVPLTEAQKLEIEEYHRSVTPEQQVGEGNNQNEDDEDQSEDTDDQTEEEDEQ